MNLFKILQTSALDTTRLLMSASRSDLSCTKEPFKPTSSKRQEPFPLRCLHLYILIIYLLLMGVTSTSSPKCHKTSSSALSPPSFPFGRHGSDAVPIGRFAPSAVVKPCRLSPPFLPSAPARREISYSRPGNNRRVRSILLIWRPRRLCNTLRVQ